MSMYPTKRAKSERKREERNGRKKTLALLLVILYPTTRYCWVSLSSQFSLSPSSSLLNVQFTTTSNAVKTSECCPIEQLSSAWESNGDVQRVWTTRDDDVVRRMQLKNFSLSSHQDSKRVELVPIVWLVATTTCRLVREYESTVNSLFSGCFFFGSEMDTQIFTDAT